MEEIEIGTSGIIVIVIIAIVLIVIMGSVIFMVRRARKIQQKEKEALSKGWTASSEKKTVKNGDIEKTVITTEVRIPKGFRCHLYVEDRLIDDRNYKDEAKKIINRAEQGEREFITYETEVNPGEKLSVTVMIYGHYVMDKKIHPVDT